jgi:hypothetical protein
MTKEKNGKAKEKKVKKEQQPHPYGPPESRAKDYDLPGLNPTLFATRASPSPTFRKTFKTFSQPSQSTRTVWP